MVHEHKCPAEGQQCSYCGKLNHFARRCYKKLRTLVNQAQQLDTDGSDDDQQRDVDMFVGRVEIKNVSKNGKLRWNLELMVNGKKMMCQLDTGADTNVISLAEFLRLGFKVDELKKTSSKIFGLGGNEVVVVGSKFMEVIVEGKKFSLKFHIIKGDTQGIIGLPSIVYMQLLERSGKSKHTINNINNFKISSLLEKYDDLFEGLGCLKEKCKLILRDDIRPTIDAPRRVPFNLLEPLKAELERMEKLDVIKAVEEPTDWVNSIVLVKKTNGNLRICLDPRNLNKAIKRTHFQFPTINNVKASLAGSTFFSTVDANSGFWTINLDEESSKLCTFITPFGRYRFLRLPFGVSSAPE